MNNLIKKNLNQKGSLQLIFCLFFLTLTSVSITISQKLLERKKRALSKSNIYLCYLYLDKSSKKYFKQITSYNRLIKISSLSLLIPKYRLIVEKVISSFKNAQNYIHFLYMKNLLNNQFCNNLLAISFLKNTPFKTNKLLLLKRGALKMTILKKSFWTNFIFNIPLHKKKTINTNIGLKIKYRVKKKRLYSNVVEMDLPY